MVKPRHPSVDIENRIVALQTQALLRVLRTFNLRVETLAKEADSANYQVFLERELRTFETQISEILRGTKQAEFRQRIESEIEKEKLEAAELGNDFCTESDPNPPTIIDSKREDPYALAQIIVDSEAVEARQKYEHDREILLNQLKEIRDGQRPDSEKTSITSGLDDVERNYSRVWRHLESGKRGAEILRKLETESSRKGRGLSRKNRGQPKAPKTRIKQRSSRTDFEKAIQNLRAAERAIDRKSVV